METVQPVRCVLPASEQIGFRTKHLCGKTTGIWPDQPASWAAHRNVLVGIRLVLRLSSQRCRTTATFSPVEAVGGGGALTKAGEAPR